MSLEYISEVRDVNISDEDNLFSDSVAHEIDILGSPISNSTGRRNSRRESTVSVLSAINMSDLEMDYTDNTNFRDIMMQLRYQMNFDAISNMINNIIDSDICEIDVLTASLWILNDISSSYMDSEQFPEAKEALRLANELVEAHGRVLIDNELNRWKSILSSNTSSLLYHQGKYKKALKVIEQAILLEEQNMSRDAVGMRRNAENYLNKSAILGALKDHENALECLFSALEILELPQLQTSLTVDQSFISPANSRRGSILLQQSINKELEDQATRNRQAFYKTLTAIHLNIATQFEHIGDREQAKEHLNNAKAIVSQHIRDMPLLEMIDSRIHDAYVHQRKRRRKKRRRPMSSRETKKLRRTESIYTNAVKTMKRRRKRHSGRPMTARQTIFSQTQPVRDQDLDIAERPTSSREIRFKYAERLRALHKVHKENEGTYARFNSNIGYNEELIPGVYVCASSYEHREKVISTPRSVPRNRNVHTSKIPKLNLNLLRPDDQTESFKRTSARFLTE
ncbi:hypothetical protein PCE1_002735 [Barthelona sp. PCE]